MFIIAANNKPDDICVIVFPRWWLPCTKGHMFIYRDIYVCLFRILFLLLIIVTAPWGVLCHSYTEASVLPSLWNKIICDRIGYVFKLSFSAWLPVQVRFSMNKAESLLVTHPKVSPFTALLVNFGRKKLFIEQQEFIFSGIMFFPHGWDWSRVCKNKS